MAGLLNKKAVKDYTLHCSEKQRNGKYTRVSAELYDALEAKLRETIRGIVHRQGSGKTVYPDMRPPKTKEGD